MEETDPIKGSHDSNKEDRKTAIEEDIGFIVHLQGKKQLSGFAKQNDNG